MTIEAANRVVETYQRDQQHAGHAVTHRPLTLKGAEQRTLNVPDGYLLLLDCPDSVVVTSELGLYDRLSEGIAELQHVHAGEIILQNYGDALATVECWEVNWYD